MAALTWFQLPLIRLTHLLLANANIGILGVCKLVTRQILGQLQAKYVEEKLASSHHLCGESNGNRVINEPYKRFSAPHIVGIDIRRIAQHLPAQSDLHGGIRPADPHFGTNSVHKNSDASS